MTVFELARLHKFDLIKTWMDADPDRWANGPGPYEYVPVMSREGLVAAILYERQRQTRRRRRR